MASECLMLRLKVCFLAGQAGKGRDTSSVQTPLLMSVELSVQIRLNWQLVKRTENEAIIVNLDL